MAQALPFIAAGASLLGGVAAVRQTQAVAAQSRYQQQVEERSADIAERDADTQGFDTQNQIMRYREQAAAQMSTTQTQLAKAGVDPGTGTALWIAQETANRADDQIAEIQKEGLITQQAILEEGVGARQRATVAGMQSRAYSQAVLPQFGGSLLSAGGTFGASAKKYGVYGF